MVTLTIRTDDERIATYMVMRELASGSVQFEILSKRGQLIENKIYDNLGMALNRSALYINSHHKDVNWKITAAPLEGK